MCLAIGLFFANGGLLKAQSQSENNSLIGRWELCDKEGKPFESPIVRQKVYVKDSYVVLEVSKKDSLTYVDFIGKIEYGEKNKNEITETPIYTAKGIEYMRTRGFKFSYKVEGEYLYLNALDGNPDNGEIWIRISK
jgi:hypothetical protein